MLPKTANSRMEDGFEGLTLTGVVENQSGQLGAVKFTVGPANIRSENPVDLTQSWLADVHHLTSQFVGIDYREAMIRQDFGGFRFASNPPNAAFVAVNCRI